MNHDHRNPVLYAIIGLLIAIVLILVVVAALFTPTTTFWTDTQHMNMRGEWGVWLAAMMFGTLVVVVLIVLAIFFAVRPHTPRPPYYPPSPPEYQSGYGRTEQGRTESLEILGQRYARGEISREEYLRMKDDLK